MYRMHYINIDCSRLYISTAYRKQTIVIFKRKSYYIIEPQAISFLGHYFQKKKREIPKKLFFSLLFFSACNSAQHVL